MQPYHLTSWSQTLLLQKLIGAFAGVAGALGALRTTSLSHTSDW